MILNKDISNAFVSILDDCDTQFKDRLTCVPRTDEDVEFMKTFLNKLGIKYEISTGYASTMHGTKQSKKTFIIDKTKEQPEVSWKELFEIFDKVQPMLFQNRQTLLFMDQDFRETSKQQEIFKNATDKLQTDIMAQRVYLDSLIRKDRKD